MEFQLLGAAVHIRAEVEAVELYIVLNGTELNLPIRPVQYESLGLSALGMSCW